MDTWPGTLQQNLLASDFAIKFGSTTVRSDMDVGVAKVRRRFTDAVDIYSAAILLDFDQFATFSAFYKTTLADGSLPFIFVDPMTQTNMVFRFAGDPDIKPLGGRIFKVSMTWEKLP